jgi:hypothetical protein
VPDLVGVAIRPSGVREQPRFASPSVKTPLRMSVMIDPGPMALTRMPCGASECHHFRQLIDPTRDTQ